MTRPKPDPDAETVVYSRCISLSARQYNQTTTREFAEASAKAELRHATGLAPVWSQWEFRPGYTADDINEGEYEIPDMWVYTCEAPGPKGLTP